MNEKWNEGITPFTGKLEVLEKMLEGTVLPSCNNCAYFLQMAEAQQQYSKSCWDYWLVGQEAPHSNNFSLIPFLRRYERTPCR